MSLRCGEERRTLARMHGEEADGRRRVLELRLELERAGEAVEAAFRCVSQRRVRTRPGAQMLYAVV